MKQTWGRQTSRLRRLLAVALCAATAAAAAATDVVYPKSGSTGARIAAGLETMLRDGSLNALFQRHKGPMIERAGLRQRRLLQLANPALPPQTPLSRRELWYDPLNDK